MLVVQEEGEGTLLFPAVEKDLYWFGWFGDKTDEERRYVAPMEKYAMRTP